MTADRHAGGGVRIDTRTLLTGANDADGDALSLSLPGSVTLAGGAISLTGTSIFYTPPAGYTNADAFNYLLSDGNCGGIAVGTVLVLLRQDNKPASRVTLIQAANGSVQVIFDGVPYQTYRVQITDSLAPANWHDVATQTADQFGSYTIVDQTATNGTRYYRSVSP